MDPTLLVWIIAGIGASHFQVSFQSCNSIQRGVRIMPLNELFPGSNPARDDVQQTDFGYDVVSRYICNNWQEIAAAQGPGAYPFDVVVIGAGMFGALLRREAYRLGKSSALRVLMLDAGAFLLQSHIQNLPQQLGGKVGGPNYLRTRDDTSGAQNVIWGMPWISNEAFPGLAYCIGGRSLFWGGWSPPLTDADLANWPGDVTAYLERAPMATRPPNWKSERPRPPISSRTPRCSSRCSARIQTAIPLGRRHRGRGSAAGGRGRPPEVGPLCLRQIQQRALHHGCHPQRCGGEHRFGRRQPRASSWYHGRKCIA